MKLTNFLRVGRVMIVCLAFLLMTTGVVVSQGISTTTVQGTVYLANGSPGAGTLLLSWPAFTTANNQAVAAGNLSVPIGTDGFVSVNLAPNLGSTPAGLYYTAVFQMSDGTVSTEYWVIPAAPSAALSTVTAQVMPAAQAVQAVTKAYVDQLIQELENSQLTESGGTLTGPLYLSGDPTVPLQAADKHYVDETFALAVPLAGGTMTGELNSPDVNGVGSPVAGGAQSTLQATVNANGAMVVPPGYAGTDGFTNANGEYVVDLRQGVSQQFERNVKEFGAVCDGVTDDTNALQAAINYAHTHNVALKIPQGTCKTQSLNWHGESISGISKQVSALMGFPGNDILATVADAAVMPQTRIHDLTFLVDQSLDVSCTPAMGRNAAGTCAYNRALETNSIFSSGGNALTGTNGAGAGWAAGNCAIAMPATTGAAGNGLKLAVIENVEIATTGVDPQQANYPGAHSTHVCGMYMAQWPQWSEFRNIDMNGLNTGIALGMPGNGIPAGVTADANRWQNITMQVTHGFTTVAGSNNVMDNFVVQASNSSAMGEPPTGLVLDFAKAQQGWSVRNEVVTPTWIPVQPKLTVTASGGAVTGIAVGPEHGLGFDPYGSTVAVTFSGACTAQANANVSTDGSIGSVTIVAGGVGCSGTTTASVNAPGTWDTSSAVNLIAGSNLSFVGGSLQGGNGGYTVWNATNSQVSGAQMTGGGVYSTGISYPALVLNDGLGSLNGNSYTGSANKFQQIGLTGALKDNGLGNTVVQTNGTTGGSVGLEAARLPSNTAAADFALLGGTASNQGFTSLNDLFLSADDLWWPAGESGGTGSQFGKDATAPVTGSYVTAVGGAWDTSGQWHVRGGTNPFVLGSGFPVGSGTWYVVAKAGAAANQELKLTGTYGSGSVCTFADKTVALTTSWQVFSLPYNTVTGNPTCDNGTQGNPVIAQGMNPSTPTNVQTAWIAFIPAYQSILLTQQPTQSNQVANKAYVDAAISNQIINGSGLLPITGGTMTGALNAPVINGTTDCALSSSMSSCIANAQSALIPVGTTGSYTQNNAYPASATCVYSLATGGTITQVNPGALGYGYVSTPTVTVNNSGSGGSGLAVVANVVGGQVTSYTITNGGSGYYACPWIAVAAPAPAAAPIPVLDQRRGMTTYSTAVRVDDFGCAGDGVTDDTMCINNAISYVTSNGTTGGTISFTSGKTYYVTQVTGYMPTAADDGTAPASGDTCVKSNAANGVTGSACTNLPPETPGELGFAIKVPNGLTIYGNGAVIKSNFSAYSTSFSMAPPDIAIFGSDQSVSSFTVRDLSVTYAFIAFASPGYASYWNFRNVGTGSVGVSILADVLQFANLHDISFASMAGIVVGGWWSCRSSMYNCPSSGDFADNITVDNYLYSGWLPTTPVGGVVANQAGLDGWFNTYFFHVGDNQTRMTDKMYSSLNYDTDSYWRGIFGIGIAYYSRYGRGSNNDIVRNMIDKVGMSYPIVITNPLNALIDTLNGESVGTCAPGYTWGTPGYCPNPYDSADNELEAAILFAGPLATTVRNISNGGIIAESVVGLSWRVNASVNLANLRKAVTVENAFVSGGSGGSLAQPESERTITYASGGYNPAGISDSGESCFIGQANGGANNMNDIWCMRNASSTYSGALTVPRYFVLENDGGDYPMNGPTGLQVPGIRVRPGWISNTDMTQMVSDFSAQAFGLSSGSVSANSCATVTGISVPGAVTTDGVLFVKAPSAVTPLQLTGQITAANTLTLNLCNPTTGALSYPTGTYSAFLLNAAAPMSAPSTSGNAPTSTSGLTTTVGDLVTASGTGTPTRLAGNTSTTTALLTETGTGTTAATPVWQTAPAFSGVNLTGLNASSITTGTLSVLNGGTGASTASQALTNLGGVSLNAPNVQFTGQVTAKEIGGVYQADQFTGTDFGAKVSACIAGLSTTYGGVCDARNMSGTQTMGTNLTIATANTTILMPCGTITTANQIIVAAGTRNVSLHGCTLRGASTASGSQGGTVIAYTGSGAAIQVGDPTYAVDTMGFEMDDFAINITGASSALAEGFVAYRTQELDLESLYFLGNSNQTAMTLDGSANYTGGSFIDNAFNGFQIAVNAIGHQISNPATTDWLNASSFLRLHIDCPTSGGSPISGTYGINLQQGDGNTFTGGDVEGCATALHLGANAQNNTIVGLRNENSTNQVVADSGSSYNSWMTGGTMFTGALTDNGTRNSFLDTFHRSFNGLNGDWYGSQKDATVTNHYRLGTGAGNERGLLNRYQTDYGYRWTTGLSDATSGEQFYQVLDELNSVYRLSIGQYNNGSGSTNNQTVINAAGTGAVVLNGSNNAGTGGVVIGSGGATETTVATIDASGNEVLNGNLQVGGTTTHVGSVSVKNQADAEIDSTLWAGLTAAQKESFIYKDWNGTSEWYLVKDNSNNWAVNSAISGIDSFKAYQSTNSGDTYVNANASGAVRINYEANSGTGFDVYTGGSAPALIAAFTGTTSIKFPGLAATSGHFCLQVDNSGFITNTGTACGSGGGGGVTSFSAPSSSWPTWLVPAVTNSMSAPSLAVTASAIPNSALANSVVTIGSTPVSLGTTATSVSGLTVDGVSSTTLAYVDATSSIQAQLNGKGGTGSCSAGQYEITDSTSGPGCAQVQYSQLGGTTPTWNQNTTGTAANLSGTPALPNGTTATTQTAGDNSANLATTAFVATAVAGAGTTTSPLSFSTSSSTASGSFNGSAAVTIDYADLGAAPLNSPTFTGTVSAPSLGLTNVYTVTLSPATQAGNYTLTIPPLSANDTLATLGKTQTFTGPISFNAASSGAIAVSSPSGRITEQASGGTLGLYMSNTTVATSSTCSVATGANPSITLAGFDWVSGASTASNWTLTPSCVAGNPTVSNTLTLSNSIASSTVPDNVVIAARVTAQGYGNPSSLTVAAGAAAGTSPTIACGTNVTCGWNGGTVNLLTGTTPTTGALFTVTDTLAHAKYPSCIYQIEGASSTYVPNGAVMTTGFYPTNTSYTVETLNLSVALTASSYYVINYHCSGN